VKDITLSVVHPRSTSPRSLLLKRLMGPSICILLSLCMFFPSAQADAKAFAPSASYEIPEPTPSNPAPADSKEPTTEKPSARRRSNDIGVQAKAKRAAAKKAAARKTNVVSPSPTATVEDPSGVPMPNVPPAGWVPAFSDDFTGTSIAADKGWFTYSGNGPSGDTAAGWDPSHLVEGGGELKIEGYKDPTDTTAPAGAYITGGLKTRFSQTYGKYEVRFRMDQGKGISLAVLLWPADGGWPPEVDFAEDNGASPRTLNTATLHYGADNSTIPHSLSVNMTQWHTLGVEWLPNSLTYTIDGKAWATVTGSEVPDTPMTLGIQTEAYGCRNTNWEQCPDSTTPAEVDMDVDWVAAYAPDTTPTVPKPDQAPSISGTPAEGQTLTASPGAWQDGNPFEYSYQWQRCMPAAGCSNIAGATDPSYTATSSDVGDGLTVVVTATNVNNNTATATSAEVGPVTNLASPGSVLAPALTGTAADGQVLTIRTGTWLGAPGATQTYQWQRCTSEDGCVDIPGMIYGNYRLTSADVGSQITVTVTATLPSGGGTLTANADATAAVANPPAPINTASPTVTGTNTEGDMLTAVNGTWSSPDTLTYVRQWQLCNAQGSCTNLEGETYSTHRPTSADVGSVLQFRVTATDREGQSSSSIAVVGLVAAPAATNGKASAA
jgi:hypothetical protein